MTDKYQGRRGGGARAVRSLAAAAAFSLAFAGCASVSDTVFLVRKVDGAAKSRAVTEQGISIYEVRVLGRQDYAALEEARRYFEVALRFDPGNTRARQYLETVDRFRESELRARTERAAELLRRPGRSEQESYAMLLLVRQAAALSPADARVVALMADTEQARATMVRQLMERARAAHDQIRQDDPQREQKLLDVKDQYDRVHAIQPDYVDLQARRSSVGGELDRIFRDGSARAGKRIDAAQFAEAREQIDRLDALNRRLDYAHDEEVRGLSYRLNYQWAKDAYGRKQLGLAGARVDAALRARRTDEAAALKAAIEDGLQQAARAAAAAPKAAASGGAASAGEAALREVQDLVRRGELAAANRRINALLGTAGDREMVAALKEQQAAVRARLPDLYARGIEAYRQEDFKRAVDLLSVVVEVDVGYEQAGDYLDKARAKQKLLESLQGTRG